MTLRLLIVDDEALARSRLRRLLGDCTAPAAEVVGEAASGHADVHARRACRVGEHRVRDIDGCALDTVGGGRVGQVRVLAHVLRRKGDDARVSTSTDGFPRVDRAIVLDVLDDPLLPVRDPERGVVTSGLDEVTGSDG